MGLLVASPSCRAIRALSCAALALLASPLVRANNVVGAWDPQLYSWPLIPVHSVLMPDSRILTYGTDGIARQTGYFTARAAPTFRKCARPTARSAC